MWKNYGLAAVNVLISSLPLLATWDPIVAAYYWLFLIALFALFSWNIVGDNFVARFIFHSKPLPIDADIFSVIEEYFYSINKPPKSRTVIPLFTIRIAKPHTLYRSAQKFLSYLWLCRICWIVRVPVCSPNVYPKRHMNRN